MDKSTDLDDREGYLDSLQLPPRPVSRRVLPRRCQSVVQALFDAFMSTLKRANYELEGTSVVVNVGGNKVAIRLSHNLVGIHSDASRDGKSFRESCTTDVLDYDPIQKSMVGKERDTFHVPRPGEPYARRSALALVAETFVRTLNKVRGLET